MDAPNEKTRQPLCAPCPQIGIRLPYSGTTPSSVPVGVNVKSSRSSSDTLRRLAIAAAYKDDGTAAHMARTGALSALLAAKIGLEPEQVRLIHLAAPMHDVGKIGIPDSILLKPGALSAEEFEIMKTHTLIGASILQDSDDELLMVAHTIALCHHERWDGFGYPMGLARDSIPLAGRLVGLVDAFDAMCSQRPYRDPLTVEQACATIRAERSKQFDPYLADVLLTHLPDVLGIRERMNTNEGIRDLDHTRSLEPDNGLAIEPSM